jgi:hypothetical protein
MNIALIMSAVKHGAKVANYCEVTDLHKNDSGKIVGASVCDNLTGKSWNVRAKVRVLPAARLLKLLTFIPGRHQCHRSIYRYLAHSR